MPGSTYADYQELIDEISGEAGETGSGYDTILLNLIKSVVRMMNTRRAKWREANTTITLVPGQTTPWEYSLTTLVADFVETVDDNTSLYYIDSASNRITIPIVKDREMFIKYWNPVVDKGDPQIARIFADILYVRPTPVVARTMHLEYYKRLTTPTLTGSVVIPDHAVEALRGMVSQRLEHYRETPEKANLSGSLAADVIRAIYREYSQSILPGVVVDTGDDDDV